MCINAVANSVCYSNVYDKVLIIFTVKYKLYISSGSAFPLTPKILGAHLLNASFSLVWYRNSVHVYWNPINANGKSILE
jgi:hypothetical protein